MAIDGTQVRKAGRYQVSADHDEIIRDMLVIAALDGKAEKKIKIGLIIGIIGVALTIFGIYLAAQPGGTAVVLIIGFIAAIGGFVFMGLNRGDNIEDRRYQLLNNLLPLLATDIDTGGFTVDLDITSPTKGSKFTHKGTRGHWNVKFFRDPWLTLSGRLMDGTRFQLVVADLVQKRSRWKTSRSGKRKHKTKTKRGSEFHLQLRYKPERYGAVDQIGEDAAGALQLPPGMSVKRLDCAGDHFSLRVGYKGTEWTGEPDSGPHMVAMLFLGAYQVLNLGRKMQKGAA